MTCIAGIAENGAVHLAGDSAGVAGWDLTVRADPKVFTLGPFVLGFSSSFRFGQLVRYSLNPPPLTDDGDLHEYMCTEFAEALRRCLRDGGWAKKEAEREEGGFCLAGVRGRLFAVESDYQVAESADHIDAIGCGAQQARGALFATLGLGGFTARQRLDVALRAAERLSAGVRGPFTFASTDGRP